MDRGNPPRPPLKGKILRGGCFSPPLTIFPPSLEIVKKNLNISVKTVEIKVALLPLGITELTKMWLRNVGHQIPKVFGTAVSRSALSVEFVVAHEGEKKPDRHHLCCGRAPCPRYLPHAVLSVWTQQKQTCRFGYPGVQELQRYHSDNQVVRTDVKSQRRNHCHPILPSAERTASAVNRHEDRIRLLSLFVHDWFCVIQWVWLGGIESGVWIKLIQMPGTAEENISLAKVNISLERVSVTKLNVSDTPDKYVTSAGWCRKFILECSNRSLMTVNGFMGQQAGARQYGYETGMCLVPLGLQWTARLQ